MFKITSKKSSYSPNDANITDIVNLSKIVFLCRNTEDNNYVNKKNLEKNENEKKLINQFIENESISNIINTDEPTVNKQMRVRKRDKNSVRFNNSEERNIIKRQSKHRKTTKTNIHFERHFNKLFPKKEKNSWRKFQIHNV